MTMLLALAGLLLALAATISNALETKLLDLVFNNVAYTGHTTLYVKLHLADPGDDGTASPAAHTTRAPVTFGAAASGAISNDTAASWTSMTANETISHISIWDAASAGECKWIGPLVASKAVTIGDDFSIPIGDLDITLD